MVSYASWLLSWRGLLALHILINLKNFPLAWELRLIYRGWRAWKSKAAVAKLLDTAAARQQQQSQDTTNAADTDPAPRTSHPLFAPLTISSHTPLLETDHNLHKSNSTYFSDLDESRTALMTHLLSSTRFGSADLDAEGYKGPLKIVLGSVHTSFLKEIKPYEPYAVRSRVLGWDRKWILIGSYFVKQKKSSSSKKTKDTKTGGEIGEVLLACGLSKYVVKKGRYTVPPERCFRSAGWLPERPPEATGDANAPPSTLEMSQVGTPDPTRGAAAGKAADSAKDLVHEVAARAAEKLKQQEEERKQKEEEEQHKKEQGEGKDVTNKGSKKRDREDEECKAAAARWSWGEIEQERARGMKIVHAWLGLDAELKNEYDEEMGLVVK